MRATTKKALTDVTHRKGRALLVVLGIFIGVFGFTTITFTQTILINAFTFSLANNAAPINIVLRVGQVDPQVLPSLAAVPNVKAVQEHTVFYSNWLRSTSPEPIPLFLISYPDLAHVPVTPFQLTSGRLPGIGEVVMEYGDLGLQTFNLGDAVTVQTTHGNVPLHIVGLARTPGVNPIQSGIARAYMSDAGLQAVIGTAPLGLQGVQSLTYQRFIEVQTRDTSQTQIQATASAIQQVLAAQHVTVYGTAFPQINLYAQSQLTAVNGIFTVLRILALLAVVMSGILILNTITTLIAEQTGIIGSMKAAGATRGVILRGYLLTVLIYSLLAAVPGVVLGVLGGWQLASALAPTVPLDIGPFMVPVGLAFIGLAMGFGVPLLSALLPLWLGTRISVHDALAAYGVSANQGAGTPTRRFALISLPQTVWLGLRDTFRKRWRAALTVLTLTVAGACFLVVQTASTSVNTSVGSIWSNLNADLEVDLGGPNVPAAISQLQAQPNVARVERWAVGGATSQWGWIDLLGVEPTTQLYQYHLTSGRWLQPGDATANVVLLSDEALQRTGKHIGDTITVTAPDNTLVTWQIIGTVQQTPESLGQIGAAILPVDTLSLDEFPGLTVAQAPTFADRVMVQAQDRSTAAVDQLYQTISALRASEVGGNTELKGGEAIQGISIMQEEKTRYAQDWIILYTLLYAVALLVGVAGAVSLANALAASVLERRREIGILRSMGANGWRVTQVFWAEGLSLGGVAWLIGAVVGLPLAYAFVQAFSRLVIATEFVIDPWAFVVMLVAIAGIAILATLAPARRAARIRVADLLRYE